MKTFAQRVQDSVQDAQSKDPFKLSPAQVEDSLMPLVRDLCLMPLDEAKAYIRASFTVVGYEALTLRLFRQACESKSLP
jgi:hypothetical protein